MLVGDCCTAEVDKLGKAIKQAKAADVHVVDEGFLDDVGKSPTSVPQLIVQHSIVAWGSDVSLPLCFTSHIIALWCESAFIICMPAVLTEAGIEPLNYGDI